MNNDPIRVLIVDDSRIFRSILESVFAEIPDVVVVGSVFNGEKAIEFVEQTPVDLVTLDVEMPVVDGLTALKAIRKLNQSRPLAMQTEAILVSALTKEGARCTVEGLLHGAIDFLLKPSGGSEQENRRELRRLLIEKLEVFRQKRAGVICPSSPPSSMSTLTGASPSAPAQGDSAPTAPGTEPDRKSFPRVGSYRAVAIGISTGGPETLARLLPKIVGRTAAPIFIVQHNLTGLSTYMAESLSRTVGRPVTEADEGTVVEPGGVFLARSSLHMIVRSQGGRITLGLSDAPPENHSRPSVDVFLRSAASVYGDSLIAAIMTGMMNDGANGVRAVKRAGGYVIAQDQATSVIWGMPRAAIETGAVDEVLPLDRFADTILRLVGGSGKV